MKKMIVPIAVVLMATGAAFATKAAKSNRSAIVDGYRIDGAGQCVNTEQQCNTDGFVECTWSEDENVLLKDEPISATMCGEQLFHL